MNNWSARVSSGEIPLFPKERATSVPIMYATIQRVNMEKLCEVITEAANAAFKRYKESSCKKSRSANGVQMKRRHFPDRCYLTRHEQLDRNGLWNQFDDVQNHQLQLRERMSSVADEKVELNLGYEKPGIIRDYKFPVGDMRECKFDQIDVRMHYLHQEMESEKFKMWKTYANGMWYIEDYVRFFQMLQRLGRPSMPQSGEDEGDFTTEPDEITLSNTGKKLDTAKKLALNFKHELESTHYRFQTGKIEQAEITNVADIENNWLMESDTKSGILTKTFADVIKMFESDGTTQHSLKREFANLLIEIGVLIPFSDEGKICFAKVQSIRGGNVKVTYPYTTTPEQTYDDTLEHIVNSYEEAVESQDIDIDGPIDEFFDDCLEAFQEDVLYDAHDGYPNIDLELKYSHVDKTYLKMPEQTRGQDVAHHVFSVLSYFFDCRDDGACRYRWEESLLDYFGASLSREDQHSDFHKFEFREGNDNAPDYKYYNNMWFQMCFFMEHNFRNAISAIHVKLFDPGPDNVGYFPDEGDKPGLQAFARRVFEREKCLFNSRSSFAGLGNVSPGLSFRKYDPKKNRNATLRHRILSQLDDELPDLDPALAEYVWKFRIPDSELFLRIIRCPNLLALRELAKQHLSNEPVKRMREVLDYFDPAIQSEIEVMLKFVQTDESVYVHTPTAHPSKRLVVTQPQLLKWMRQAVGCASFASSLGMLSNVSPLQCKYDLFLNHVSFHVLSSFFCTRIPLNSGTKRPLRFILLQLKMVDMLLRCENVEDCVHSNDHVHLYCRNEPASIGIREEFQFLEGDKPYTTPCVVGTSRRGWPKRDINKIVFKSSLTTQRASMLREYTEEEHEMTDDELRLWMLLAYARPDPTLNSELNVSLTQEKFMRKSGTKGDCEDVELHYSRDVQDNKPCLSCTIHTSQEHMFFERYEKAGVDTELPCFPAYVRSMIPDKIDRMLVYVPKTCADILREQHTDAQQMFTHDVDGDSYKWRPVFAGIRTWCWKRLLVKMVFLHAVGKIMTGTKTLLSLYGVLDGRTYTEIVKTILKPASEATGNTLGDLSYKLKWIPDDVTSISTSNQKSRTVLSLYKYKERILYGHRMDEITVCSPTRGQFTWLDYVENHKQEIINEKSSRFMRLDKQQVAFRKISNDAVSFEASERFFSHRDYVYFLEEKKDLYVNLRGTIYVKFPTSFALRTVVSEVEGVKKKETKVYETNGDTIEEKMYCVMFDTRRHDWFRKIKVEDNEDMDIIHSMTYVKMIHPQDEWLPVLENNFETLQWVKESDVDTRDSVSKLEPGYAFINSDKDLNICTLFTMPDFQYCENIIIELLEALMDPTAGTAAESCVYECNELVKSKTWWSMRAESGKLMAYRAPDKKKLFQFESAYEDTTIAKFMGDIDAILTPSASESMEH